jgi:hypothetical protein
MAPGNTPGLRTLDQPAPEPPPSQRSWRAPNRLAPTACSQPSRTRNPMTLNHLHPVNPIFCPKFRVKPLFRKKICNPLQMNHLQPNKNALFHTSHLLFLKQIEKNFAREFTLRG